MNVNGRVIVWPGRILTQPLQTINTRLVCLVSARAATTGRLHRRNRIKQGRGAQFLKSMSITPRPNTVSQIATNPL